MTEIAGKVVMITGGNTGIGKEAAVGLAGLGARVVITSRNGDPAQSTSVNVRVNDKAFDVHAGDKRYRIELHTPLRDVVIRGTSNGEPFCAQIERIGLAYRVMHNGTQIDAKVFTPRAAELNAWMPFKPPPDLSKFLLSPMPGLLVDVSVAPGQKVLTGEKLAVIEAMKMENILLAAQDGVVGEVVAKKGESLAVDQVIIRFA